MKSHVEELLKEAFISSSFLIKQINVVKVNDFETWQIKCM